MFALTDLRTNGASILEEFPTQFEVVLNNDIQTGNHKMTVELEFIADGLSTGLLSRGLYYNPTGGTINAPNNYFTYNLLLLAPGGTLQDSFFFPQLRTIKVRNLQYRKDQATTTRITFSWEQRNVNVTLFYQDTIENLINNTPLGPISPITLS